VHAIFTHAVMAPGAADRLSAAGFGKVLTTDSIPVSPDLRVEVVPITPLLARTVRYLCGESATPEGGMGDTPRCDRDAGCAPIELGTAGTDATVGSFPARQELRE
jgi:hypothetical protein